MSKWMPIMLITKRAVDAAKPGDRDKFLWDSEIAGLGLKISPAGRKVYVIQFRMGGRGCHEGHLTPKMRCGRRPVAPPIIRQLIALPAKGEPDARADFSVLVEPLSNARIDRGAVADHRSNLQCSGICTAIGAQIASNIELLARKEAIPA